MHFSLNITDFKRNQILILGNICKLHALCPKLLIRLKGIAKNSVEEMKLKGGKNKREQNRKCLLEREREREK